MQEAFLELFVVRYSSFEFELPPGTRDIRVFLWFRERSAQKLAINIEPLADVEIVDPTKPVKVRAGVAPLAPPFPSRRPAAAVAPLRGGTPRTRRAGRCTARAFPLRPVSDGV